MNTLKNQQKKGEKMAKNQQKKRKNRQKNDPISQFLTYKKETK